MPRNTYQLSNACRRRLHVLIVSNSAEPINQSRCTIDSRSEPTSFSRASIHQTLYLSLCNLVCDRGGVVGLVKLVGWKSKVRCAIGYRYTSRRFSRFFLAGSDYGISKWLEREKGYYVPAYVLDWLVYCVQQNTLWPSDLQFKCIKFINSSTLLNAY